MSSEENPREQENMDTNPETDETTAAQDAQSDAVPEDPIMVLTDERDALRDQCLRLRAEFDNFRKRMARETDRIRKTAAAGLAADLLPVLDNLGRALETMACPSDLVAGSVQEGMISGVRMVAEQFASVLSAHGVEVIPAVGEPFDPNVHEALARVLSEDIPSGHVAQEYLKGYRMGDFVLRASKVVVSMGPAAPQPMAESDGTAEPEAPETD